MKKKAILYNCGGFALGTYDRVYPDDESREDVINDLIKSGLEKEYIYKQVLESDTQALLKQFPSLSVFSGDPKSYVPKENEELIAYRIWVNDDELDNNDFHFKVFRDGKWQDKCGALEPRFCLPAYRDASWDTLYIYYDSPTVYFINTTPTLVGTRVS